MRKSCPLGDPEIGIITENDHRVGLCLCKYCICGKHLCPSLPPRSYLPYRSNYQVNYSPKKFDKPLRMPRTLYKRNALKMDLDLIEEVRRTWQFYRDRRPDTYDDMVKQLP